MYAFDARTGKRIWAAFSGDVIDSSPTVANGVVYVGSQDHKLYALDTTLSGLARPTKVELLAAIEGHVLAHAELVGTYQKGS